MKKRTACLLTVLMMVCTVCFGAAGEAAPGSILTEAYEVLWAAADYAVIREEEGGPACMVRMSDGETLYSGINSAASTGSWLCIYTDDGSFLIGRDGSATRLGDQFTNDESYYWLGGKYGLLYSASYDGSCLYNPSEDTYVPLPANEICDVYRDSAGQVYVLTRECGIYRADGTQILEPGKYRIAWNCNFEAITNEYLTVWDESNSAAVLSPYTGEVIHTFTGLGWEAYDENHQIYRDNTASIGPADEEGYYNGAGTMVVGLDGTILRELPDGYVFSCRCEGDQGYSVENDPGGAYNPLTDRMYWFEGEYDDPVQYVTCEETGEKFRGDRDEYGYVKEYQSLETGTVYPASVWPGDYEIMPERLEKYKPVQERVYWLEYIEADWEEPTSPYLTPYRVEIIDLQGSVLGDRYWKDVATGWVRNREMIEGYNLFETAPVCAMIDENDMIAVINTDGAVVLPSEYEKVCLTGTFSDDPKEDGYALAARKDGQWYLFTLQGEPLSAAQ